MRFTSTRTIIVALVGLVALALPVGWLLAAYLAGFGVPPAARVLIALLVVPALVVVAAFVVPLLMTWRFRRRVARFGSEPPPWVPDDLDPDALSAISRQMGDVEASPLRAVIGVGQIANSMDVVVELLAVELRAAGGLLTVRAIGTKRPFRMDTMDPGFPQPDIAISDDVGTPYLVFPSGGGGSDGVFRYELKFAPAPPPAARNLTITVRAFRSGFPRRSATSDSVEGSWQFAVELPSQEEN